MLRAIRLRKARGDRGAAAVEFAIVLFPLMLIILGILEYSFFLRDFLSVSSMTRVAARAASSGADAGSLPCPGTAPSCRPGDMPALAEGALIAMQKAGSAVNEDEVQQLWVYKANDFGFPGTATTVQTMMAEGCVPNAATDLRCVKYQRVGGVLVATQAGWDYNTIDACIDDPDAVGVYMQVSHDALTGFGFPGIGNIEERSVMAFEPLSPETCRPGAR